MEGETANPAAQCEPCLEALEKELRQFPAGFPEKMAYLIDLHDRIQAGWRVRNEDLTLGEWRMMYQIQRHSRLKDMGTMSQIGDRHGG